MHHLSFNPDTQRRPLASRQYYRVPTTNFWDIDTTLLPTQLQMDTHPFMICRWLTHGPIPADRSSISYHHFADHPHRTAAIRWTRGGPQEHTPQSITLAPTAQPKHFPWDTLVPTMRFNPLTLQWTQCAPVPPMTPYTHDLEHPNHSPLPCLGAEHIPIFDGAHFHTQATTIPQRMRRLIGYVCPTNTTHGTLLARLDIKRLNRHIWLVEPRSFNYDQPHPVSLRLYPFSSHAERGYKSGSNAAGNPMAINRTTAQRLFAIPELAGQIAFRFIKHT